MSVEKNQFDGLRLFRKMAGGYFIATIINNAIPFLLLPVLTRHLSPDAYANIALFTAFVAVVNALSGSSINIFIARHFFDHKKEYVSKIIGNGLLLLLLLNTFYTLVFLFTHTQYSGFYGLPLFWMLLIPLNSFSYLLFHVLLGVLRNQSKVLSFSYNQIGNTFINIAVSVFLIVVLVFGWQGRVAGILVSNLISATISFFYLKHKGFISFTFDPQIFRQLGVFILTLIPNGLQSVLVTRIGIFLMQLYFTKEMLGIYSVGYQISYLVMIIVTTLNLSLTPFLFKQLSAKKIVKPLFITRMIYLHVIVVAIGVLFVNIVSDYVLKYMTTPKYYDAKQFILWLTLGMFFNGMALFIQPFLIRFNQQKFIGLTAITSLLAAIAFHYLFTIYFDYIGIAYAYFASCCFIFIVLFIRTQKHFTFPFLKALKINIKD